MQKLKRYFEEDPWRMFLLGVLVGLLLEKVLRFINTTLP